jgi:glycosyltransferase involved in cell wall biosynthesis
MKELLPIVSIIMPTLNSEKTIELSLRSIRSQDYPKSKVEILVIDGGSTDNTLKISLKYDAIIIKNPSIQQEYAKHIGLLKAKGKYACFLDSDEVLNNNRSIKNKVLFIEENPDCGFVVFSGYIKPKHASSVNSYINLYSDPFAYFMYGISTDNKFYFKEITKKYITCISHSKYKIISIKNNKNIPLIDLCAGNMLNLESLKKTLGNKIKDPMIIPNLFEEIISSNRKFILMKKDPVVHNSSDSYVKYVRKIHWRVLVNTHYTNIPGTGYANREVSQNYFFKVKKYLFVLYGLSVVFPLFDSIKMYLKTSEIVSFIHPLLTLYTAVDIIFQRLLFLIGYKPRLTAYGKKNIGLITK